MGKSKIINVYCYWIHFDGMVMWLSSELRFFTFQFCPCILISPSFQNRPVSGLAILNGISLHVCKTYYLQGKYWILDYTGIFLVKRPSFLRNHSSLCNAFLTVYPVVQIHVVILISGKDNVVSIPNIIIMKLLGFPNTIVYIQAIVSSNFEIKKAPQK